MVPMKGGFDKHGRPVLLMRYGSINPKTMSFEDIVRLHSMMVNIGLHDHPHPVQSAVRGLVLIEDLRGATSDMVRMLSPANAKKFVTLVEVGGNPGWQI